MWSTARTDRRSQTRGVAGDGQCFRRRAKQDRVDLARILQRQPARRDDRWRCSQIKGGGTDATATFTVEGTVTIFAALDQLYAGMYRDPSGQGGDPLRSPGTDQSVRSGVLRRIPR